MEQGVLKSIEPKMENGVHGTFQGDKGLNYKFTISLDDKDVITTGTAMSSKIQPSWKIGDLYSYEKTIAGASGQYINIKVLRTSQIHLLQVVVVKVHRLSLEFKKPLNALLNAH